MAKNRVKAKVPLPIGLESAYVALLTKDDAEGTTYETPEYFARAIKATITPILATGTLESEDEVEYDESEIIGYTLSFEASQLDDHMRALIFGHKIDEDGGIIVSNTDKPPELAFMFRTPLSDKKNFKYVTLYKGSFKPNEESYETKKKESITYSVEGAIEGNFYCRTSDGACKYSLRSDSENASTSKIEKWFTAVQEPNITEAVRASKDQKIAEVPAK